MEGAKFRTFFSTSVSASHNGVSDKLTTDLSSGIDVITCCGEISLRPHARKFPNFESCLVLHRSVVMS